MATQCPVQSRQYDWNCKNLFFLIQRILLTQLIDIYKIKSLIELLAVIMASPAIIWDTLQE